MDTDTDQGTGSDSEFGQYCFGFEDDQLLPLSKLTGLPVKDALDLIKESDDVPKAWSISEAWSIPEAWYKDEPVMYYNHIEYTKDLVIQNGVFHKDCLFNEYDWKAMEEEQVEDNIEYREKLRQTLRKQCKCPNHSI
jgi:hypothetical protein